MDETWHNSMTSSVSSTSNYSLSTKLDCVLGWLLRLAVQVTVIFINETWHNSTFYLACGVSYYSLLTELYIALRLLLRLAVQATVYFIDGSWHCTSMAPLVIGSSNSILYQPNLTYFDDYLDYWCRLLYSLPTKLDITLSFFGYRHKYLCSYASDSFSMKLDIIIGCLLPLLVHVTVFFIDETFHYNSRFLRLSVQVPLFLIEKTWGKST